MSTTSTVVFAIFAGIDGICLFYGLRYFLKHHKMLSFSLPALWAAAMMITDITVAVQGEHTSFQGAVFQFFDACIIPLTILTSFELALLVHKRRSVNFCGIAFDEHDEESMMSSTSATMTSRLIVWGISMALLTIGIIVNFSIAFANNNDDIEKHGWYSQEKNYDSRFLLKLLPVVVLLIFSFYLSIKMCIYGTNYSYVIHATYMNPWIWMIVGTIGLWIGYLMPDGIYEYSSSAGQTFLLVCTMRMLKDIHHDVIQCNQMEVFLAQRKV